MKSPGTLLREARESKGLSIAEVAAMTRIPRTTLLHLEQDRFEEMQAGIFVRGHLRNYARELNLDAEALVRAYEKSVGHTAPVVVRNDATVRPAATEKKDARKTTAPAARNWVASITATHMFALALVATAVVLFVSLLSGSRATAKDQAQFPQSNAQAWELEQDVQETRWLLEQPQNKSN